MLWYEQTRSTDEILEQMRLVEPVAPPYTTFIYQNVMYAAAGRLTEVVAGTSWADFIDERLFTPLGMERSVALLERTKQRDNVAAPHHTVDGEVVQIENASVDAVAAAGSVWSSVAEMAEWAKFLLRGCRTASGEVLLQEATCNELFTPQTLIDVEMYPAMRLYEHKWFSYGLGWFQTDYNGRDLDFHSGSIDGLVALHGLVREEALGVIVLGNLDHAEVRHALMYRALDLFDPSLAPSERRDWNREIKDLFDELDEAAQSAAADAPAEKASDARPPLAAGAYIGTYNDPFLGDVVVSTEGDSLRLRFGRQTCTLESRGGDVFDCQWQARWRGGGNVTFVAASPGRIGSLKFAGQELQAPAETTDHKRVPRDRTKERVPAPHGTGPQPPKISSPRCRNLQRNVFVALRPPGKRCGRSPQRRAQARPRAGASTRALSAVVSPRQIRARLAQVRRAGAKAPPGRLISELGQNNKKGGRHLTVPAPSPPQKLQPTLPELQRRLPRSWPLASGQALRAKPA